VRKLIVPTLFGFLPATVELVSLEW
jgi:hypothetical protein